MRYPCLHLSSGVVPAVMRLPRPQKSSQKADEYLREIKEQNVLEEAVRQCVEAAAHEYDPATQKSLMRVRGNPMIQRVQVCSPVTCDLSSTRRRPLGSVS